MSPEVLPEASPQVHATTLPTKFSETTPNPHTSLLKPLGLPAAYHHTEQRPVSGPLGPVPLPSSQSFQLPTLISSDIPVVKLGSREQTTCSVSLLSKHSQIHVYRRGFNAFP